MIGGGQGGNIGAVHRMAARLDGQFQLVAGALSSDPERARASGAALGLDPARSYGSFSDMARAEAARPDGVEAVAIVTPNHLHAAPAITFLEHGVHVICDKPLTATMAEAEALARAAEASPALFILTHNYTGYPMIRQARAMVASGALGAIRLVQAEYIQDWLSDAVEAKGSKQAEWRTDPARAGLGGALGDIGTHAWNLAAFVSGMEPEALAADLTSFVPGRSLDDNAHVMLRYASGARGALWCSQVASGQENALSLRIFGDKAGIEWHQEEPNCLWFSPIGAPRQRLTRGGPGASPEAARVSRVPGGHPEGYIEAFATLYAEAAEAIRARQTGEAVPEGVLYPDLRDGLSGMRFIAAAVASARQNSAWVSL
ncbi:Gfo/Idh/MocA family oxidoreductase [Pseudogemmobacter sp. CC-YST710]|uniref:Gfo/Idh/MocA family oxidoreductase n=2 Tax=Pseudogemmobacter faecipullorum TaxID=2755041 RepID=A0ABS8CRI2_9RHOB|nr:Gfo/Idh/MocA family oxidoreductase [Pseudogemmobacter faecipullorum]